jgi:hypothetical protein
MACKLQSGKHAPHFAAVVHAIFRKVANPSAAQTLLSWGEEGSMSGEMSTAEMRRKAGHQEILGETLAKFEFFQHGWHPYTRFLDVDKIDLILRRRRGSTVEYREVQVKFGKLYQCTAKWELPLFSVSSWRFFSESALTGLTEREGLFLAYVLAPDDGFKGDMFVFPMKEFAELVRSADRLRNGDYRVYLSRPHGAPDSWYMRRVPRFTELTKKTVHDVTKYYRNFACLG